MKQLGTWIAIVFIALVFGSGMAGCAKKLDQKLCDALVKKFNECKLSAYESRTKNICKVKLGKRISDYDKMKSWSEMNCADLLKALKSDQEKRKKH